MKKIENTIDNKVKFFAQYIGHQVEYPDLEDKLIKAKLDSVGFEEIKTTYNKKRNGVNGDYLSFKENGNHNSNALNAKLLLKPISEITDEDTIEVAKLAHERYKSDWKVIRNNDNTILHVECTDSYDIKYHISIMFDCCTVNANMYIPNDKTGKIDSFKINIGEVHYSSKNPIGYIAIVDYLRSKGYSLPSMGLSVEDQISYGWIK